MLDALEHILSRARCTRTYVESWWPRPLTVAEPVTVAELATVAELLTVANPVTVLDALEHMLTRDRTRAHVCILLDETKMTVTMNPVVNIGQNSLCLLISAQALSSSPAACTRTSQRSENSASKRPRYLCALILAQPTGAARSSVLHARRRRCAHTRPL